MKRMVSVLLLLVLVLFGGCQAHVPEATYASLTSTTIVATTPLVAENNHPTTAPTQSLETTVMDTTKPDEAEIILLRFATMLYTTQTQEGAVVEALPEEYVLIGTTADYFPNIPRWAGESWGIAHGSEFYASVDNPNYLYYALEDGYQRMIRTSLAEQCVEDPYEDPEAPEKYTLLFFEDLFTWNAARNYYNQAFCQEFWSAKSVDIARLFYNGTGASEPLTEEEKVFLSQFEAFKGVTSNMVRYRVDDMETTLQRYFGLSLSETYGIGKDRMLHYYDRTNSYYRRVSDLQVNWLTVLDVVYISETNTYKITVDCNPGLGTVYVMTLKKVGDVFQICSNILAE